MKVVLGLYTGTLGGPRTYGIELVRALVEAFPGDEWIVLTDRTGDLDGIGVADCIRVPLPARALRPLVETLVVPRLLRRLAPDLYHGAKQSLPPFAPCPLVATIHDLAYHTCPGTFPLLPRLYLKAQARSTLRRARRILVPSESTAGDMVRILGADRARLDVVPPGVAEAFRRPVPPGEVDRVRGAYRLPARYVSSVGTLQPRKNPDVLLEAFARLKEAGGADGVGLVFAGRRGWGVESFLADLARRGPSLGAVHLESIPDGDVAPLLAGSEVFVSPTSYEGFGLSIAEAMALGLPVIAGGGSSVPEVVGDAGVLLEPRDPDALAEALGDLLADPDRRRRLGEAARARAGGFTWSASARAVRDVYEAAAA